MKAQQEMLKRNKNNHIISADFLIICLQTLAREICNKFCKEWKKNNTRKDLKQSLNLVASGSSMLILQECVQL